MGTAAERLVEAREKAGLDTAREGAERTGVPYYTYVQHENGTRGISKDKAATYARAFGVEPTWLLYGKGSKPGGSPRVVPMVGYVGAGAEAHYQSFDGEPLGDVDAPEGATEKTVAVEVRGTSLGPLFERWLIFYDDVRTPVTPDLHGRLCIVGLSDKVLVKLIKPARRKNHFHLLSNNEEPLFDQEVLWAARVRSMTPR